MANTINVRIRRPLRAALDQIAAARGIRISDLIRSTLATAVGLPQSEASAPVTTGEEGAK